MSTFAVTATTTLSPQQAFEVATDWPAHSRVPFTSVRVTADTGGVGTRFVGHTRVGRFGFADSMEVVEWRPPAGEAAGFCRVVKTGSPLRGDASIDVAAGALGGAVVRWRETILIGPAWLARLLGPAVRLTGPVVFGWVLRSQLREAESRQFRGTA